MESRQCGACEANIDHMHFNSRYCSTVCRRLIGRAAERSHPDYKARRKATCDRYISNNPEARKTSSNRYRENNLDYYAGKRAERRAAQLERTPVWLTEDNKADILSMYSLAKKLEGITGIQYEVDHVIPLRAEEISGLHVPWNLQILTKSSNRRKGNRYGV